MKDSPHPDRLPVDSGAPSLARSAPAARLQSDLDWCAPFVLRLIREESTGRKRGILNLNRQNEVPGNAMVFVSNLQSSSQAGRRGFESRVVGHQKT